MIDKINTAPRKVKNIISEHERQELLDYLAADDQRTDHRPDVRSKHPVWGEPGWPQHIIESAMIQTVGEGFVMEEITFRQDKIGLKPHTDDGDLDGVPGKTMIFMLDARPRAETVFFGNRWPQNPRYGGFFTKQPWNPFAYQLEDLQGEMVRIPDLRDLLEQCKTDPASVSQFAVTAHFIDLLESLIQKRSLPKLEFDTRSQETGYMQPGLRVDRYHELTDYRPGQPFDADLHRRYLRDIDIADLEGLTVDEIIEWEPCGCMIFDRDQLHCSSSNHEQKSFITIFYHHPQRQEEHA
jgi:hypothetical protein